MSLELLRFKNLKHYVNSYEKHNPLNLEGNSLCLFYNLVIKISYALVVSIELGFSNSYKLRFGRAIYEMLRGNNILVPSHSLEF